MSENESPTIESLGSEEQVLPKAVVKESVAKVVVDEAPPVVTNGDEALPPAPPSPKMEEDKRTEAEEVKEEEEPPPAAAPMENGEPEGVLANEEAPLAVPAAENGTPESAPSAEEVYEKQEEPPAKVESVSSPEEAPVVTNNHQTEECPVVKVDPPTVVNGREPPMTESVGATEMTRMANFGFNYTKLVRGKPKGPLLPDAYLKFADKLYNFEFRNEDVMVMGFPRSGTTWVTEIVWALTNIDQLHLMDELGVRDRALWIEKDAVFPGDLRDETRSDIQKFMEIYPGENPEDGVVLKLAEAEKSPRHFVTHLPPQLHNPEMLNACKVIYVARNPKDVCLSWYNFNCNLQLENQKYFEGEFAEFVEGFKAGYVMYSPFWEHISQAWQKRHHRNVHFLFYEDLKTDIMGELRRLSSFLRLGHGDEQLKKVSELTSFQSMKGREDKLPIVKELQTSFFHKGEVGSWEGTASPLVDARMVAWINENLQGTGIKFAFN